MYSLLFLSFLTLTFSLPLQEGQEQVGEVSDSDFYRGVFKNLFHNDGKVESTATPYWQEKNKKSPAVLYTNGLTKFAQSSINDKLICEWDSTAITCPVGSSIQITGAFWGRYNNDKQNCFHNLLWAMNTDCGKFVQQEISKSCDGRTTCSLTVSQNTLGQSGCGYGYLNLAYVCNSDRDIFSCEGSNLFIGCPSNLVVKIKYALYGRTAQTPCETKGLVLTKECGYPDLTAPRVLPECDTFQNCSIPVKNDFFSYDPCWGTAKYLRVKYECTDPYQASDYYRTKKKLMD